MNKWLGFIIAVLAVIGSFYVGHKWQPPQDVEPVGFHAKGQVKINENNAFSASGCKVGTTTCSLIFDFSESGGTIAAQPCGSTQNCLSFSNAQGDKLTVTFDLSNGTSTTPEHLLNGRVQAIP